jgi:glyoxylase-like metal-dependent hydrolase (beta-lactamase superfamily II)
VVQAAIGGMAGIALGVPALLRAPRANAQQGANSTLGTQRLSDDLHMLTVGGTNALALSGVDGVVLVDGGSAFDAAALLQAVAGLPGGGPVHTLFNTHWHPEQTGSNEPLGRAGATIIAHENTRLWLTTDITWPWDGSQFTRLPEVARPNKTFYDRDELAVGSHSIQYGYLRHAAHTDGDLYVYFPDSNVLAVGDAITGAGWQIMDWRTGGWIGGVVGGLELLLSLTDAQTRIVPARGPVLSRADLEEQFAMYDTICERIFRLLYSGRSPDEAVESLVTVEFDAKMGNSDEFVRRAFESTWAYLSPDA